MRDAIAFANKTPFETGQVIEATAKFESMGLSAKKWLSITSDMAGATSKDMIQAVEAVIDAVASGEFERLKEFGLSKKTLEDLDVSGKNVIKVEQKAYQKLPKVCGALLQGFSRTLWLK